MNLAGPMFQFIQPGAVEQIRINDKLTTNIWERWEVGPVNPSEVTMRQFLQLIEDNYGIVLKAINLLEGGQIYSVFGEMENNKALKETFLQTTLTTVLLQEMAAQEIGKFVDMTLVFAVDEELAKHVPTLRVLLQP